MICSMSAPLSVVPISTLVALTVPPDRLVAVVAMVAVVAVAAFPPMLRLATGVVEVTVNGAVPVATVEVTTPLNAPVVAFTDPPDTLVAVVAARLATGVVEVTVNGAVPVATFEVTTPLNAPVVAVIAAGVAPPITVPSIVPLVTHPADNALFSAPAVSTVLAVNGLHTA